MNEPYFNRSDFVLFSTKNGFELNQYIGASAEVTIPSTIDDKKIVSIGDKAFRGLRSIRKVTIGDGIEEIKSGAFANCVNLSDVVFPDSLRILGSRIQGDISSKTGAFSHTGITTLNLPESLLSIGPYAFSSTPVNNTIIPDNVKTIGRGAFEDCFRMEIVKLPNGLFTVETNLFRNCALLKEIIFPDNLHFINSGAFSGDVLIKHLVLPYGLMEIGANAFAGCNALQDIFVPFTVVKINDCNCYGYMHTYNRSVFGKKMQVHCHPESFTYKYCIAHGNIVMDWDH